MKKPTLYLMVGIPGSGKTTFIKKHLTDNDVHISRDEVRFAIVPPDAEYFSQEDRVFAEWINQICWSLRSGFNVYADATHISPQSRAKTLRGINYLLKKEVEFNLEAIVLNTPLDTCLERNSYRTGRELVPEKAIKNMRNSFRFPEIQEGFTRIYRVGENQIEIIKGG